MPKIFNHAEGRHFAGRLAECFRVKRDWTAAELKSQGFENPAATVKRQVVVAYLAVLGYIVRTFDSGSRFEAVGLEPSQIVKDAAVTVQSRLKLPYHQQLQNAARRYHIMLTGPRGTGKTTSAAITAAHAGKALIAVTGHADLTIDELRGAMTLKGDSSVFVAGPVPYAILRGAWLLFDEVNLCRPGVSAWMKNVIDGTASLTIPETMETISVPSDFRVFFCLNEGYSGTRALHEGLRDSCRVIFCDYWERDQEEAFLKKKIPEASSVDRTHLLDIAGALRTDGNGGTEFDFSVRSMEMILAEKVDSGTDLLTAFERVVIPKVGYEAFHRDEHQALIEVARNAIAKKTTVENDE